MGVARSAGAMPSPVPQAATYPGAAQPFGNRSLRQAVSPVTPPTASEAELNYK